MPQYNLLPDACDNHSSKRLLCPDRSVRTAGTKWIWDSAVIRLNGLARFAVIIAESGAADDEPVANGTVRP
jgi:hypothetical protein